MGKKWLVAVRRVFSSDSKEKNGQRRNKSKKRWGFWQCSNFEPDSSEDSAYNNNSVPLAPQETYESVDAENDRSKHAYSVALASAVAAEAAVVAAQAAAEVVRLTKSMKFTGRSKEEVSAIKIQTAFRGYLARRALRALRGLVRLRSLTNSNSVKHQAAAALRCMQTMARVQVQIRSRRIRMSEEIQALQRQLHLKHERELEKLRMAEDWDDSLQSKEQIEAHLQHKQDAAIRRERALAYAFSHQWKGSSRSSNPTFMDPNNPQWGWSWLERWMEARTWEKRDLNNDHASARSATRNVTNRQIAKAYARRHSPSTPPSKPASITGNIWSASLGRGRAHTEDDSSSIPSIQLEWPRWHSIAGSPVKDDESLGSTMSVPSYMAATESAKAKSRYHSPVGSAARKRLSFPVAAMRRPLSSYGGNGSSNGGRRESVA